MYVHRFHQPLEGGAEHVVLYVPKSEDIQMLSWKCSKCVLYNLFDFYSDHSNHLPTKIQISPLFSPSLWAQMIKY